MFCHVPCGRSTDANKLVTQAEALRSEYIVGRVNERFIEGCVGEVLVESSSVQQGFVSCNPSVPNLFRNGASQVSRVVPG